MKGMRLVHVSCYTENVLYRRHTNRQWAGWLPFQLVAYYRTNQNHC